MDKKQSPIVGKAVNGGSPNYIVITLEPKAAEFQNFGNTPNNWMKPAFG